MALTQLLRVNPRRTESKSYELLYVLLFSILAIVDGYNSPGE